MVSRIVCQPVQIRWDITSYGESVVGFVQHLPDLFELGKVLGIVFPGKNVVQLGDM